MLRVRVRVRVRARVRVQVSTLSFMLLFSNLVLVAIYSDPGGAEPLHTCCTHSIIWAQT
jgi:hypothetical protein